MNGIDISSWQPSDITSRVDYDFVIIKATEGFNYVSPHCNKQYELAKARGKLVGVYHFLSGLDPIAEADFFIDNVQGYIGEAILVLDWEANAVNMGREWLRRVIRRVKERTKAKIVIYGSLSPMQANNIQGLAKEEGCLLWVAAYPNYDPTGYREEHQALGSVIRQYASTGRLPGYNANLDLNRSILTRDQWHSIAIGAEYDGSVEPLQSNKTNGQIASEVVQGLWGNGEDRRNRLTAAGYNWSEIQAIVNGQLGTSATPTQKPLDQIVNEVIGGLWGNGDDRTNRLKGAGYDVNEVQKRVNDKLGLTQQQVQENPVYYTVPSGIAGYNGATATKFGISVNKLIELNKDKYPNITTNYVQAGWVLRVK